jgi:membrane-bound lytic murein transglycosylase A
VTRVSRRFAGHVAAGLLLAALAAPAGAASRPMQVPNAQLEPVSFGELDGWAADDHAAAFATFLGSCRVVVRRKPGSGDARPMYDGLIDVCRRALRSIPLDAAGARAFFERNFRPVRISPLGERAGFLTGYYEPIVEGSRTASAEYKVPVYSRPSNLIVPGRRVNANASLPNTGRVGRRIGRKKIVPYFDRAEIEDGALHGRQLEICWLKDPIDLFFSQIQGSARVRLEDGSMLRLNYDAHNGHPYLPVGRVLIERKIYTREQMSMDRIREWMEANPEEAKELRRMNRSYVFFRLADLSEFDEAMGAQGIPLAANRSIAVDRKLHVYGTPFFIEAELPIADETPTTPFRRLTIAQDTGSAIIGPARADIYFGVGEMAGRVSGRIKHPGRFVMLVPNEIDPVEAGRHTPLPMPRPPVPVAETKERTPAAADVTDRKPTSAQAGTVPLPRAKPKPAKPSGS